MEEGDPENEVEHNGLQTVDADPVLVGQNILKEVGFCFGAFYPVLFQAYFLLKGRCLLFFVFADQVADRNRGRSDPKQDERRGIDGSEVARLGPDVNKGGQDDEGPERKLRFAETEIRVFFTCTLVGIEAVFDHFVELENQK